MPRSLLARTPKHQQLMWLQCQRTPCHRLMLQQLPLTPPHLLHLLPPLPLPRSVLPLFLFMPLPLPLAAPMATAATHPLFPVVGYTAPAPPATAPAAVALAMIGPAPTATAAGAIIASSPFAAVKLISPGAPLSAQAPSAEAAPAMATAPVASEAPISAATNAARLGGSATSTTSSARARASQ